LKRSGIAALSIAALLVGFVLTRHTGPDVLSPGMQAGVAAHRTSQPNAVLNAPLPPSKGQLRIRGKVIDSAGPVADAVVTATGTRGGEVLSELNCQCGNECGSKLLECGCGEAARQLLEHVAERRGEAQPLARTRSAQDGSFELSGFEAERVTLWAEKAGVGIGARQGVEAGEETADVTLETGISITGKIADENGNPVPNALVTAIFSQHSRFFDAIASETGEFSISPVPLGTYRLVASARGLLPAAGWATKDAHSDLSLEMLRPRRIAGKVLRGGARVAQAQVQIEGEHRKASLSSTQDGSFTFSELRPGTYDLTARSGSGGAHLSLEVEKTDVSDLVLALEEGASLEGVVKDSSGAPIAKAKITISRHQTTVSRGTAPTHQSTDGSGRFRADLLEAGEYRVDALAAGFVGVDGMRTAVERGQTAQLAITLERASRLGGTVVDASGKPVANASLQVSRSHSNAMDSSHEQEDPPDKAGGRDVRRGTFSSAKSSKDGTFQFDYLRDGDYKLSAEHDGFIQVNKSVWVPDTALRIVMEEGATVSGVVVGKGDVPQPNVTVYLETIPEREYLYPSWKKHATTDDRGQFQIKAVEEGKYLVLALQAVGKARTGMRTASARVTVEGGRSTAVTLRFEGTASMSGSVIDAAGNALASVKVTAYPQRGQKQDGYPAGIEVYEGMASTTTQEDGAFEIDSLRPEKYVLRPEKKGFVPQESQGTVASPGDTHVRLVMNPLGAVRGRVLDPAGAPIHNFAVNREQFNESTGQFSVPVYSTGDMTVRIHAPGFAVERRQVKAIVGENVTVPDITLSAGRVIRGKVLDAANAGPVSGALVNKGPIEESPYRHLLSPARGAVYTNGDGSFSLLEAESGPVQLVVEHSKYRQYRGVIAPDQSEATVLLLAGSSLSGRVLDSDQKPVAGARVSALGEQNFKTAETSGDGSYQIGGFEAGRYTVSVSVERPGAQAPSFMSRQVDLPETGAIQLDFAAPKDGATLQVTVVDHDVGPDRGPMLLLAQGEVTTPRTAREWRQFATPLSTGIQENGATIFRGLPAGHYTLFVLNPVRTGRGVHRETLDVESGRQKSIRVNLPAELPIVSFVGED